MDENEIVNNLIPPFLRTLATRIENKEISDELLQKSGEFYMSCMFTENDEGEFTDRDFVKFITMGWWIYTQIPTMLSKDEK